MGQLVKNSLSFFIAFVFSTALLGGSSYLLFGARTELNALEQTSLELTKRQAQAEALGRLTKLTNSGWLANQANLARLSNTLAALNTVKTAEALNTPVSEETVEWFTQALSQLAREKEQIDSLTFESEVFRARQEQVSQMYEGYISIVDEILAMLVNWDDETQDERVSRLKAIEDAALDSKIASVSLSTSTADVMAEIESQQQENEQRYKEVTDRLSVSRWWLYSSYLGVTSGTIALIAVVYFGFYLNNQAAFASSRRSRAKARNN